MIGFLGCGGGSVASRPCVILELLLVILEAEPLTQISEELINRRHGHKNLECPQQRRKQCNLAHSTKLGSSVASFPASLSLAGSSILLAPLLKKKAQVLQGTNI